MHLHYALHVGLLDAPEYNIRLIQKFLTVTAATGQ